MRLISIVGTASLLVSSVSIGMAGCGGADVGSCPPASDTQQSEGHNALKTNCLICHSSQQKGAARHGAPDDLNFDDLAVVRSEADTIYSEVIEGAMPPDPNKKLSESEAESLRVWLACGAK